MDHGECCYMRKYHLSSNECKDLTKYARNIIILAKAVKFATELGHENFKCDLTT